MRRVLSSIGIGSATVDTIVPTAEVRPGETVELTVETNGGETAQTVQQLYFSLNATVEEGGTEVLVERFGWDESFTVEPGEERTISFEYTVPLWTPITRGGPTVWLETGLDIDWAVDPSDSDGLTVVPDKYVESMFEACSDLGFEFQHSVVEETPWLDDRPFAQKFVFTPTGAYEADIASVSLTTIPRGDDLRLYVEVEQRDDTDGVGIDFNEQELSVTIEYANPEMIARRISTTIQQFS